METFSALLAICARNSPGGNSPARDRWIPHTKASDAKLLMFSLIFAWINGWLNNRKAGDLRRHRAHYYVIVMEIWKFSCPKSSAAWKFFFVVVASFLVLKVLISFSVLHNCAFTDNASYICTMDQILLTQISTDYLSSCFKVSKNVILMDMFIVDNRSITPENVPRADPEGFVFIYSKSTLELAWCCQMVSLDHT